MQLVKVLCHKILEDKTLDGLLVSRISAYDVSRPRYASMLLDFFGREHPPGEMFFIGPSSVRMKVIPERNCLVFLDNSGDPCAVFPGDLVVKCHEYNFRAVYREQIGKEVSGLGIVSIVGK